MCKQVVQGIYIAAVWVVENNFCQCYETVNETEFEFRSLMACGKKLLLSLSVFAIMLLKRLPNGSKMKRRLLG